MGSTHVCLSMQPNGLCKVSEWWKIVLVLLLSCCIGACSVEGFYRGQVGNYSQKIRANPEDISLYFERADAYNSLHEYEKAAEDYSRIIELDSSPTPAVLIKAYRERGLDHNHLGEYKKAIEDLSKAISLDSKDALACSKKTDSHFALTYTARGEAYERVGNVDLAARDLVKSIELGDDSSPLKKIKCGMVYYRLSKYQAAIDEFSKGITEENDHALRKSLSSGGGICFDRLLGQAYYRRSQAYEKMGWQELADRDLARAKRMAGDFYAAEPR